MAGKARILFVDDERRVLNAMRGLFRREYELFLANSGAEALQLAAANDIDVIVADQRMPQMTGIEVLSAMRQRSPRTVRILLTGYADPSAIEGSINEGEVFRFLSKPCPPQLLRETLGLAIDAANTEPAPPGGYSPAARAPEPPSVPLQAPPEQAAPPPEPVTVSSLDETTPNPVLQPAADTHWDDVTSIVMSGSEISELHESETTVTGSIPIARDIGVVVFTVDSEFAVTVIRAVSGDRSTVLATTLAKAAQIIHEQNIGVLVTDFTSNPDTLQKIVNVLKMRMPQLVTIVASNNRDSQDMINLINYGQIFRYVVKPIEPDGLRMDINAAVLRHVHVVNHPEAGKRHHVGEAPEPEKPDSAVSHFVETMTRPVSVATHSAEAPAQVPRKP